MTRHVCSIDGCGRKYLARGWCNRHYRRWRKHGDPLTGNPHYSDPEEAFMARAAWDGDCLIWTGSTSSAGYGQLNAGGQKMYAHRFSYERVNGPIPDGMVIDHICHTPACVLPGHLRLATHAQNNANLSGVRKNSGELPRGVTRRGRRYRARVKHNGTEHYLGLFATPESASAAAETKRAELFGEYAGRA